MTDTTHWAPSDAMAALDRGHDPREVMEIAYCRAATCSASFDYVGNKRWADVGDAARSRVRAAARSSGQLHINPWVPQELGEEIARQFAGTCRYDTRYRREIFGEWASPPEKIDILNGSIPADTLRGDRPSGLNSPGDLARDEATFRALSFGRRGGKMRAWEEQNKEAIIASRTRGRS